MTEETEKKLLMGLKIVGIIVGSSIVLFGGYKILKAIGAISTSVGNASSDLGLTTSSEQRDLQGLSFLQGSFYKSIPNAKVGITRLSAQRVAMTLHDSVVPNPGTSGFSNIVINNEAVVNLFKSIPTKVVMSWIADQFEQMYHGKTITGFVIPAMSNEARIILLNYLNSLPHG